ncbi:MAG: hypothetical protein IJA70_11325, partial [Oscillospiraceae bacterium]|nr:hypothetical protein [Oscillospiraceae bacterium]
PSKKWGYISNENGGFCGTIATGQGGFLLHHLRWSPSSSEEVLISSGNPYRIPPVLAKPKPPPFNKGGFQQKSGG